MRIEYVSSMGMGTTIRYNGTVGNWQLLNYDDTVLLTNGASEAPLNSFGIGKHSWTIENDSTECFGGSYVKDLKLTSCLEDQFTCHNGRCVPMVYRSRQISIVPKASYISLLAPSGALVVIMV